MNVRFARLRIAGFKSFADAASLDILPGLTGIVGPNGCGKSNVVEALRWTMGESSARSLRGGEMDDLIFAGTAARPARNLAEVTLTLEQAAGIAPPPHDQPELQISRRIERGAGSSYHVNGREMRARDVQTLFADLASGARSSAMVSQGRVAAIVNARPDERRSILEEAAGITGLHARRHEAELKLRATEANLARAEDLRLQLEARLGELDAQSRQASRYREVAARLRDAEAALLALLHARARLAVRQARAVATATEAALRDAEPAASAANEAELRAEASMAEPREAEAVARGALERLRVTAEMIGQEEARAARDAAEALGRFEQAAGDADEASARLADAQAALARIEADQAASQVRCATLPAQLLLAEEALDAAAVGLAEASEAVSHATAQENAARDQVARIARDREAVETRLSRLDGQRTGLRCEYRAALLELPAEDEITALQTACGEAAAVLEAARVEAERAGEARIQSARAADAAQAAAREAMRAMDAARRADDETAQRATRIAAELNRVRQACDEARAALVPEAARLAASNQVQLCHDAFAAERLSLEAMETARSTAQQAHAEARQRLAEAERLRQQITEARQAAEDTLGRATSQHDQLAGEVARAEAALVPAARLQAGSEALARAEAELADAQALLADAETAAMEAAEAATAAGQNLAGTLAEQARIEAEADGLARAVGRPDDAAGRQWLSLAETLSVPPGLEAALAAVLAEGLDAALDEASPRHWRSMPSDTRQDHALPAGIPALSTLIDAPDALHRILSHAGLIEETAGGQALQPELAPGQCLVTRAGTLWRWDGYRVAGGQAADRASARGALLLEQRRRLRQARVEIEQAAIRSADLRDRAAALAEARTARKAHAADARLRRDSAERGLTLVREQVAALTAQSGAAIARLDAIVPQHRRAGQLRHEAIRALADAETAALPEMQQLQQALDRARIDAAAAVTAEAAARQARQQAEHRLEAARSEAAAQLARHGEAESRLEALLPQHRRLTEEHATAGIDAGKARSVLEGLAPTGQAQEVRDHALAAAEAAQVHEAAAQAARQEAERQRDRTQVEQAEATSRLARQRSRIEALAPRLEALDEEYDEAAAILVATRAEAAGLADPELAASASGAAREALNGAREHEAACRETRAQLVAEAAALEAARQGLAAAREDWSRREAIAHQGHASAMSRRAADAAAHEALAEVPKHLERRRQDHRLALAECEQAHVAAGTILEEAAQALVRAQAERRQADSALSEAREATLRLHGRAEQADAILAQLLAENPHLLAETLAPPQTVPNDLSEAAEAGLRRRIIRLTREREEIGPVNLRAEIESREAQARADAIASERDELEAAIARLRGSIGHLNREGRERLLAVFETVDAQFQTLFARMFNGGRARLGMVGDDDPLLAGLEIYAQPPGKKLATLSLLSGGEQALTALSLIFAVFRCNPAPVCVLDEVDAPLDDANVGRFCALLADMAAETGTRFLIVTHHQLTMAHMDRLYGVTMQERGVSRLLSVDLAAASGMVASKADRVESR